MKVELVALDDQYLNRVPDWFTELYPDEFPDELNAEQRAVINDFFLNTMVAAPRNEFYGIALDGQPAGVVGFTEQNPFERSAVLWMVVDREVWKGYRGKGRAIGRWLIGLVIPDKFSVVRAHCGAGHRAVANLLCHIGFQEVPMVGTTLEFRGG